MSVFIIAEAGVNHNGSLELAKKLIDVAVTADAVKFQTFKSDKLVSKTAQKAQYQKQIEYSCPIENVDLWAMKTISEAFRVKPVWCSDHTNAIEVPDHKASRSKMKNMPIAYTSIVVDDGFSL